MAGDSTSLTKSEDAPARGSFSLDIERRDIAGAFRAYTGRLRAGDPGALPSVLGLVALVIIFSQVSARFLTKNNIGNLPGQGSYIALIALGLVFVLLLGEIDLSAGTTGGVCAGIAAQGIGSNGLRHGVPGLLYTVIIIVMVGAIIAGLLLRTFVGPAVVLVGLLITLTGQDKHVIPALIFGVSFGAAVGLFIGLLVARVGIPSFIVTLALFLAFQGLLIFVLNSQPISISSRTFWNGLANYNMSPFWSWVYVIVLVGGYFAFTLVKSTRSRAKGLSADTLQLVVGRAVAIGVVGVLIVIFANDNRNPNIKPEIAGLPWAAVVPVSLMIISSIMLTKTTWGRHLFATGGNAEAARRAGINVVRIKVTAFTLCSSFGALGGIFLASYTGGVQLDLGAGNVLLFSVAAAVIGGTSLFGGRGKARDAIIGALVIVIIPNGIGLRPSLPAQYNNIITGGVLLLAAAVDALSRRRSAKR
ncbi:MAG TPA: ABC transporter permease [Jatrophihabitans sp.]|jgi:D-xylose transport system permease protein|uniref:sugar ABC transporter permease n=1 Tax=Jatrophihabitans sp. TaxID=1932789 RepID=UPI002E0A7186|nr:ABC transporter permease [Jatrophihabitans sp.]